VASVANVETTGRRVRRPLRNSSLRALVVAGRGSRASASIQAQEVGASSRKPYHKRGRIERRAGTSCPSCRWRSQGGANLGNLVATANEKRSAGGSWRRGRCEQRQNRTE